MKFFFVNFDFKNGCKNEFEDNNDKSWFKIWYILKIDFRADWTDEFNPTAWELKNCNLLSNQIFESLDSMSGILPSGLGQDYHQTDFLYDSDI